MRIRTDRDHGAAVINDDNVKIGEKNDILSLYKSHSRKLVIRKMTYTSKRN